VKSFTNNAQPVVFRGASLAFVIALAGSLLVACGADDAARDTGATRDATTKRTSTPRTDPASTAPVTGPEPTAEHPIAMSSPKEFQTVAKSFTLAGRAIVDGGSLVWAIDGADGVPLIQGRTTASCAAPCTGEFSIPVVLTKVPIGSYELHVWSGKASDPASAPRTYDTLLPITIARELPPGAPPPDAIPPGGTPQPTG